MLRFPLALHLTRSVLWTNPVLDEHEISLTLMNDAKWCIGSIIFVGTALAYHTQSLTIAVASLSGIFAAFLLAFWVYTRVMGVTEMPMLNFLSVFVLLGVGAGKILKEGQFARVRRVFE